MKKVLFFETWNQSPHLETSFEIAVKHLVAGDRVKIFYMGYDTPYKDVGRLAVFARSLYRPEKRITKIIKDPGFELVPRVKIGPVAWDRSIRFSTIDELRAFTHNGFKAGLAVASSLISETFDSKPDLRKMRAKVRRMLDSSIRTYAFVRRKLAEEKPDLAYVFNGRFVNHRAILQAVQDSGVEVWYHERGGSDSLYFLRPYSPFENKKWQAEMLAEWSSVKDRPEAVEAARRFFITQREIGYRSFSSRRVKGAIPELPEGHRVVSYFTSSDHEFQAVNDLVKWEAWPDQMAALLVLMDVCRDMEKLTLIIRFHPNFTTISPRERREWASLPRYHNVVIIDEKSPVDTYALIEKSDVIVTTITTVGIEAVFMGKPCICLGPAGYTELGAVYTPKSREELCALLARKDLVGQPDRALPYGYYYPRFGQPYTHYIPTSPFSGTFMGVDLQRKPFWLRAPVALYRSLASAGRRITLAVRRARV